MRIFIFFSLAILFIVLISCNEQDTTLQIKEPNLTQDTTIIIDTLKNIVSNLSIEDILLSVFSEQIDSINSNYVYFSNGNKLIFDDKQDKNFTQMLENADIQDQFEQNYPLKEDYLGLLTENFDPGRIRSTEFFKNIYGCSASEVKSNSTSINWFGRNLIVSKVNDVHLRLDSVKTDLLKLDTKFHKYFKKTAGTFNWRKIAGTKRLSAHSFAVAIDLNTKFAHYWRWGKPDKNGKYPYKNLIPIEIVEVFEKYGFIWGGKWYHYDTMHFEYRPELIYYSKNIAN